jgi:hypothetical protein
MPNQRYIVYTRPNGCVSVCAPSTTALRYMTGGGGRWDGHDPGFLDRQLAEQSKHGIGERNARAFINAMQFGGCTDAEAYGIMRDRFCAHLGTGCELWCKNDIPDRWFRDAWRRSPNGGPVRIDLRHARKIQLNRIKDAAERHKLRLEIDLWLRRTREAETPEQLKQVFPRRESAIASGH